MSILERKLSKLNIKSYSDREMKNIVGNISAMYNPNSLRMSYINQYKTVNPINQSQYNQYVSSQLDSLALEIIFDAKMPGNGLSLDYQIKKLHGLCYAVNPTSNAPNFLCVSWGKLGFGGEGSRDFSGRVTNLSINYTLFDRDGTPLRATVLLTLASDPSLIQQKAHDKLKSPPVAVITVPDASSLPIIAMQVGAVLKGGIDYLSLANINDLDSLNDIKPGQILKASSQGGKPW